jgi:spore coat protein U-like protein
VIGLVAAALVLGPLARPAETQGVNCTISATGVAFGSYSVFAASPTDSTGTVSFSCTLAVAVTVQLSKGSASTFSPRTLKLGAQALNYNLYLDSTHSTIWGDGTGGTSVYSQSVGALVSQNVTVYGRVPALQNATIGSYSDSVTATIVF